MIFNRCSVLKNYLVPLTVIRLGSGLGPGLSLEPRAMIMFRVKGKE